VGPGRRSLAPEHEHGAIPVVVPSPAHITEPVLRHTSLGECPSNWLDATVCRYRFVLRDPLSARAATRALDLPSHVIQVAYCGRPAGPIGLARDALREGSRVDEVEREIRADVGEQPRALADDHRADE
jgi:hypothetical protein